MLARRVCVGVVICKCGDVVCWGDTPTSLDGVRLCWGVNCGKSGYVTTVLGVSGIVVVVVVVVVVGIVGLVVDVGSLVGDVCCCCDGLVVVLVVVVVVVVVWEGLGCGNDCCHCRRSCDNILLVGNGACIAACPCCCCCCADDEASTPTPTPTAIPPLGIPVDEPIPCALCVGVVVLALSILAAITTHTIHKSQLMHSLISLICREVS